MFNSLAIWTIGNHRTNEVSVFDLITSGKYDVRFECFKGAAAETRRVGPAVAAGGEIQSGLTGKMAGGGPLRGAKIGKITPFRLTASTDQFLVGSVSISVL